MNRILFNEVENKINKLINAIRLEKSYKNDECLAVIVKGLNPGEERKKVYHT